MSWQASKYARTVCEDTPQLTRGARLVLMLCAERAGSQTGHTLGGNWLARAASLKPASVRRALHELAGHGIIAVDSSRSRALMVRFPTPATLSTTRHPDRAVAEPDPRSASRVPGIQIAGTRHPDRAIPTHEGLEPHADRHPTECLCGGYGRTWRPQTGWADCTAADLEAVI